MQRALLLLLLLLGRSYTWMNAEAPKHAYPSRTASLADMAVQAAWRERMRTAFRCAYLSKQACCKAFMHACMPGVWLQACCIPVWPLMATIAVSNKHRRRHPRIGWLCAAAIVCMPVSWRCTGWRARARRQHHGAAQGCMAAHPRCSCFSVVRCQLLFGRGSARVRSLLCAVGSCRSWVLVRGWGQERGATC